MARRYFIDENGLRQGLYQSWHPSWRLDGKPHIKANYKDGKLEGEYTVWYDNGVLEEEANYKDGKRYIRRGWIEGEANYKDDKLEGEWKKWHDNGRLEFKANYKDGKLEGKIKHYNYRYIFPMMALMITMLVLLPSLIYLAFFSKID